MALRIARVGRRHLVAAQTKRISALASPAAATNRFGGSPWHFGESIQDVPREVARFPRVERAPGALSDQTVIWFPAHIRELDLTVDTLDGGTDLINEDHPGFHDLSYRVRREEIAALARAYRYGDRLPRIQYLPHEVETWRVVYERIQECHVRWACHEYREMLGLMEQFCGFAPGNIPQLEDISNFLQQKTGFTMRPIAGMLSARDFLNALAFRVFYSTQYTRHHKNPFYTPEADVCHELLGHVPLLANPAFADFSQEIGLVSLAASDEDIDRLAAVYHFTVEFGLLREGRDLKAYGAGLLSSFGEMEWSCAEKPSLLCREMGSVSHLERPDIVPLDPMRAAKQLYPFSTYQPLYFCAESLEAAKEQISQFCSTLQRPFSSQYDPLTQTIRVSQAVKRAPRVSMVEMQAQKQRDYFEQRKE